MSNPEKQARIFRVLSVETRVSIIALLKDRALCVNALARVLKITPAAASQHLRILRAAGVVKGEKRGYFVHYKVNCVTLAKWKEEVEAVLKTTSQ